MDSLLILVIDVLVYLSIIIGIGVLCDDLYKLKLDGLYAETIWMLHHNVGTKHSLVNERSVFCGINV